MTSFFFLTVCSPRDPLLLTHSFPTRRSPDLTHGAALGVDEVAAARETLGWTAEPFVIPADIAAAWVAFGETGRSEEHTSELQSLMRISYAVFCLKKKIEKADKIHEN